MQFPSWWLKKNWVSWLLWPLSLLFGLMVRLRYLAYQRGFFAVYRSRLTIIVVGNISVGGTGKTPLVIAMVRYLQEQGYKPAVISRGYKSQSQHFPFVVTADTPVALAGDEPLLIAKQTGCEVVIAPKRVQAVRLLEEQGGCDIIISDDGLQHYALARDQEIVVLDGLRLLGNGFLLPAGMLRESAKRLARADLLVVNGGVFPNALSMQLEPGNLYSLADSTEIKNLADFRGKTVHAVAGIGNPARFFELLKAQGINIIAHAFADHHIYQPQDLNFTDEFPIIMTEKDAVKCLGLSQQPAWYLPVNAILPDSFYQRLLTPGASNVYTQDTSTC